MDRPPPIVLPVGRPLTTAQAALVRLLAQITVEEFLGEQEIRLQATSDGTVAAHPQKDGAHGRP